MRRSCRRKLLGRKKSSEVTVYLEWGFLGLQKQLRWRRQRCRRYGCGNDQPNIITNRISSNHMTNFLDNDGLHQVLQSVNHKIADSAKSVFKTDSTWEAASLTVLEEWVSGNTATDSINNRTVNNYDVYLAKDTNAQYYFDSGTWVSFAPDLTDYYTKGESDARYPTMADFAEINLAANSMDIPAKLAGYQQIIETILTTPVYGLISAIQTTTVTVQFTVGSNTGTATLPYDGAIATAKIGGLVRIERLWNRTVQSSTVSYTLNTTTSRCYFSQQQQADWNETDTASPRYIQNKPTIPQGVEMIDSLTSTRTDASLSANMGRVLDEKIDEMEPEPLTTATINTVLMAAGFPAIV